MRAEDDVYFVVGVFNVGGGSGGGGVRRGKGESGRKERGGGGKKTNTCVCVYIYIYVCVCVYMYIYKTRYVMSWHVLSYHIISQIRETAATDVAVQKPELGYLHCRVRVCILVCLPAIFHSSSPARKEYILHPLIDRSKSETLADI